MIAIIGDIRKDFKNEKKAKLLHHDLISVGHNVR